MFAASPDIFERFWRSIRMALSRRVIPVRRVKWTAAIALLGASMLILGPFGSQTAVSQSSDTAVQQRMARLVAGVQAAEAIRASKRLEHSYSHYLELGLWSDLADLFTA